MKASTTLKRFSDLPSVAHVGAAKSDSEFKLWLYSVTLNKLVSLSAPPFQGVNRKMGFCPGSVALNLSPNSLTLWGVYSNTNINNKSHKYLCRLPPRTLTWHYFPSLWRQWNKVTETKELLESSNELSAGSLEKLTIANLENKLVFLFGFPNASNPLSSWWLCLTLVLLSACSTGK